MDREKIKRYKDWDLLSIAQDYGFSFSAVGGKLRGLCLFHGDSGDPNLFIYPDDTFYCFACKKGWSKSQFVAYAEKVPRKVIDSLWEKSTDIRELLNIRLQQRTVNYRDALLLLVATFCYNNRSRDTSPYTQKLRALDADISAKSFIDLEAYTQMVKQIEEMK